MAVAGGPLAATLLARLVLGKNKLLNLATAGSGAWLAVKTVSGPVLGVVTEHFGDLHQVFARFGA